MFCWAILIEGFYMDSLWVDRLDDAFEAAQKAARLDSNNKEVGIVVRRTRGVISARAKGNDLFKASRFSEACIAYGEGLDHDPFNSVLLCNRATCRSKLGQFEKAVEDCTAALSVRPSYSKARLRRADCNAKVKTLSNVTLMSEEINTIIMDGINFKLS